jgi:hypothetical protein
MNRADFLKRLGLGAIGIAVAPKVISDVREAPLKDKIKRIVLHETDTYYNCYTAEPDWAISDDAINAEQAWQDHVLHEVFLKDLKG